MQQQGRTGTADGRTEWNGAETGGTIANLSYSLIGEVSTKAGIRDGSVSATVRVLGGGSASWSASRPQGVLWIGCLCREFPNVRFSHVLTKPVIPCLWCR